MRILRKTLGFMLMTSPVWIVLVTLLAVKWPEAVAQTVVAVLALSLIGIVIWLCWGMGKDLWEDS